MTKKKTAVLEVLLWHSTGDIWHVTSHKGIRGLYFWHLLLQSEKPKSFFASIIYTFFGHVISKLYLKRRRLLHLIVFVTTARDVKYSMWFEIQHVMWNTARDLKYSTWCEIQHVMWNRACDLKYSTWCEIEHVIWNTARDVKYSTWCKKKIKSLRERGTCNYNPATKGTWNFTLKFGGMKYQFQTLGRWRPTLRP
jgi:hypothetical protein